MLTWRSAPPIANLESAIDTYLKAETEQKRFSEVVLIAKEGKPLIRRAYGFVDWTAKTPNSPETAFLISTNTKQSLVLDLQPLPGLPGRAEARAV